VCLCALGYFDGWKAFPSVTSGNLFFPSVFVLFKFCLIPEGGGLILIAALVEVARFFFFRVGAPVNHSFFPILRVPYLACFGPRLPLPFDLQFIKHAYKTPQRLISRDRASFSSTVEQTFSLLFPYVFSSLFFSLLLMMDPPAPL